MNTSRVYKSVIGTRKPMKACTRAVSPKAIFLPKFARRKYLRSPDAKLADKNASLHSRSSVEPQVGSPSPHASPTPQDRKASQGHKKAVPPQSPAAPSETNVQIRQDLAEAQRSRGVLEGRLQSVTEELRNLRIQSSLDTKAIQELSKEKDMLVRRVKDRDEEIRGKAKLLEDVHDEMVSLTLQLNMADDRVRKVEGENKELVERWMKRMGEEAEEMNEKSKFS